jgi:phage tail-like protein
MNFTSRAWAGRVLTVVAIAVFAVVVANAQKAQRQDPLPAFSFAVEIGGQQTGFFRSVSGLSIETEVIEFQEGGNNSGTIRKLAGVTRYANIRLTRGFTGDRSLYDWFVNVQKPNPIKVNGRIIMFDRHGVRVTAWKFTNGFPVKYEAPELDASSNEIAIESIEIAHEGLSIDDGDD